MNKIYISFFLFLLSASTSGAIPTSEGTPGELHGHFAPEMGRLAIIDTLGDYVITIPESPSSPANTDHVVRAWDVSNPRRPVEVGQFGVTRHPFLAHGSIKRNNEIFIGGGSSENAIRLNPDGSLQRVGWSGPRTHFSKGGMMHPWGATDYWEYNGNTENAQLRLNGVVTATWNHLEATGVTGFANFMGNLLIYASDQQNTGVAVYDVSDPANPRLLDVFNTALIHPTIRRNGAAVEYGIGGYWNEIYSHYIVFARRGANPGIQVVDFSDPSNLRLHCDFLVRDPRFGLMTADGGRAPGVEHLDDSDPMYLGFQDEYVFAERFKLNIETCEVELRLQEVSQRVDTSQYARPIGNLLYTGGLASWRISQAVNGIGGAEYNSSGLGVWTHQAAADTRPPKVAYHIPRPNQTNYPLMVPISLMIPETLNSLTITVGQTLTLTKVDNGGGAVAIDYVLSHTGMLTVDPLQDLEPNTTYEVRLADIEDAVGNKMAPYSFRFSTGATLAGAPTPEPDPGPEPEPVPEPESNQAPVISNFGIAELPPYLINGTVTFTVNAADNDGDALEYRFNLGDGAGYSPWSSSSNRAVVFASAGDYRATVQVRDNRGGQAVQVFGISILESLGPVNNAIKSGQIACEIDEDSPSNRYVWVANPDNDSVTRIHPESYEAEEFVLGAAGDKPTAVAMDSAGRAWVTASRADSVLVLNPDGSVFDEFRLAYGSAPQHILISPADHMAYVSLYNAGTVIRINTETLQMDSRAISLGMTAGAMALTPDGSRLLINRHVSGENWAEVWVIEVTQWANAQPQVIKLHHVTDEDTLESGSGVPNYLADIVVHPNGSRAYVVGKKDNVMRGVSFTVDGNAASDLDDDNTVRTTLSVLDLESLQEITSQRQDFDNADSPSALARSPDGRFLFVALQGLNKILTVELTSRGIGIPGNSAAQFTSGLAPQGLCFDPVNTHLFASNFTERTVTALDLTTLFNGGNINPPSSTVSLIEEETLEPDVLRGKQVFYNAIDPRMSAEGYISCATCHVDGGHDGRTWDFTGRGEGLRNTPTLLGRRGTHFGNVHWSGNFDEIQDFEFDIRNAFRGMGFISEATAEDFVGGPIATITGGRDSDLDALAAYVTSLDAAHLPRSPHRRPNGNLTTYAQRGSTLFVNLGCHTCHSGDHFSDGKAHNVGTQRKYSGGRLGGALTGIQTPSLLSLFASAPYLHDGSAATLSDVFSTLGGDVYQAETANVMGSTAVFTAKGLRDGGGVLIDANTSVRFGSIAGGEGGNGFIRFRYGGLAEGDPGNLQVRVNGVNYPVALKATPAVDDIYINFTESSPLNIPLNAGNNSVEFHYSGAGSLIIDDLTVTTTVHRQVGSAHTVALALTANDRYALEQYLLQLDGTSQAPSVSVTPQPEEPAPVEPGTPEPEPLPQTPDDDAEPENPPAVPMPSPSAEEAGKKRGGAMDYLLVILFLLTLSQAVAKRRCG